MKTEREQKVLKIFRFISHLYRPVIRTAKTNQIMVVTDHDIETVPVTR